MAAFVIIQIIRLISRKLRGSNYNKRRKISQEESHIYHEEQSDRKLDLLQYSDIMNKFNPIISYKDVINKIYKQT